MGEPDPSDLEWRKSSKSDDANCVEVAVTVTQVLVRDSKDRSGTVLEFSHLEWEGFLARARRGEYRLD
jgi:Domain of unknown function (DUF397)